MRAKALTLLFWILAASAAAQGGEVGRPDALLPDGGRYFGPLVDGKMHGRGVVVRGGGSRYEGDFVNGLASGKGRLTLANGVVYEGEFSNGMMSGSGRMTMPDGSTYVGRFSEDWYWGRGDLTYADGRRYTGDFVRGAMHGHGRFEAGDGQTYEGTFANNAFSGPGTYLRKDGSRYEGEFLNWRFHGKGRFVDAAGNAYEGTFVNGELEGPGVATSPDGGHYSGEFKQSRFDGQGTMRLPNGDVYVGRFENGLYHGEGTLTYAKPQPDGRTQLSGTWRFGTPDDAAMRRRASTNLEAALYSQRAILDSALSALGRRDPGVPNMFVLAVAGDGSQEVFRREVEFVSRQFAERFGTARRTVMLVNSRNTLRTTPMATATSIREALAAIAARMDREQDILFLFITSHGSKDQELVLGQIGLDLPDISAGELGTMVRESGIRWRVVVVSACYSGGFLDSLKDEHAMVITAARHDRQSFGCADENDFTYFGRAFFKEALPQASSFQEAFKKAAAIVREMELQDAGRSRAGADAGEVRHSFPQLWTADPIETKLRLWWPQPR